MSCAVLKREMDEMTPTRKRKRETNKPDNSAITQAVPASCFTNAAFSSTPKKVFGRRRTKTSAHNENLNPFTQNSYLEVKSIAEILQNKEIPPKQLEAADNLNSTEQQSRNPYEVQRKPPKKKKRQNDIADACFENPALNLEVPEKQFNPYEVIRAPQKEEQCFVNEALNIRGQDQTAMRNPFEIQRNKETAVGKEHGIANPCMNTQKLPSSLKIGLPFTPTLGCRIDFKNMSLSQLTPSCKDLVFSPVPLAKRSLGAISEEESSVSIGKELDLYQLELENSINEAKLRKNGKHSPDSPMKQQQMHFKLQMEHKITLTQKLEEIVEAEEDENENIVECKHNGETAKTISQTVTEEKQAVEGIITYDTEHLNVLTIANDLDDAGRAVYTSEKHDGEQVCKDGMPAIDNNDVAYASESEDEDLDFKAPAPFVRAYRTALPDKITTNSKESLNSNASDKPNDEKKPKSTVKNAIRNSIRKLMHPNANKNAEQLDEKILKDEHSDKLTHVIQQIRHSLRRKPNDKPFYELPVTTQHDVSIIDSSERTMKFKSAVNQTEYLRIEDLSNEKRKHTLRSSFRQTTRDMMQTVFHKKHEGYALNK